MPHALDDTFSEFFLDEEYLNHEFVKVNY